MGEAGHAPPASVGRGASLPPRGGAAIFGTVPGARLNTIKVRLVAVSPPLTELCSDQFHPGRPGGESREERRRGRRSEICPPSPRNYALLWREEGEQTSQLCFHLLHLTPDRVISLLCNLQFNQLFYFILYICFDGKIRELCIFRAHLILSSHLLQDRMNTEVSR